MRSSIKLLPVLLLGSTIGGCSLAGTGDYFADHQGKLQNDQSSGCDMTYTVAPQTVQMPALIPTSPCAAAQSFAAPSYAAAPAYGAPTYAPSGSIYGNPIAQNYPQYGYGHEKRVKTRYGNNDYAPAYVTPRHGASDGLRQAYTYGSLGATMYDVDSEIFGAQARLGWQSKSLFGAELEGSAGFGEDLSTVLVGNTPIQAETGIDTQLAAFGVARLPVSQQLNLLGRVGYHKTNFHSDLTNGASAQAVKFSTDGLAYGVGAEYAFGPKTSLRADYTLYDYDGFDANAVSLAIARKF